MSILACNELTKIYKGSVKALDSVTFSMASKGIFALIGRNGAGKTTLVRILATELKATSGTASIDGLDVDKEAKKLRERIAIVPQEARALSWMTPKQTISAYLMWRGFSYGEAKEKALESLAKLGLSQYANVLNGRLSGGTKRKVLVATVIASEADFVFLDEPTTGLDPISRRELWGTLRELGKERFTFLTTHYLEEAEQLADSIGILKEGKLVAIGSLNDLRKGMRYGYSVKFDAKFPLSGVKGDVTVSEGGYTQVLTNEDEAYSIARMLVDSGIRYSLSPVTLDDIFFRLVGQTSRDD